jgi:uncharacterized membrane protein
LVFQTAGPYIRGMVIAAKGASQMVITGSLAFGGVAAVIEPVVNVLLLPLHDRLWLRIRS